MNRLFILVLAILSVYSANCMPNKLCQDSIFNFDNKDVNAFFKLEMGSSLPGTDEINLNQFKNVSFDLKKFPKSLNKVANLDRDEIIKKVKESKARLDQGFPDEAVCSKDFLSKILMDIIKRDDREQQSLVLDNGKIEVYYDKKILKLLEFTLFHDKENKKETGYLVRYNLYIPVNIKNYTPDECVDSKDFPAFFSNKGK